MKDIKVLRKLIDEKGIVTHLYIEDRKLKRSVIGLPKFIKLLKEEKMSLYNGKLRDTGMLDIPGVVEVPIKKFKKNQRKKYMVTATLVNSHNKLVGYELNSKSEVYNINKLRLDIKNNPNKFVNCSISIDDEILCDCKTVRRAIMDIDV